MKDNNNNRKNLRKKTKKLGRKEVGKNRIKVEKRNEAKETDTRTETEIIVVWELGRKF